MSRKLLYDVTMYEVPRLGLFMTLDPKGESTPEGWKTVRKDVLIIGETDDSYIYELRETDIDYYIDKSKNGEFIMPMGIHKSWFKKWLPTQQKLF